MVAGSRAAQHFGGHQAGLVSQSRVSDSQGSHATVGYAFHFSGMSKNIMILRHANHRAQGGDYGIVRGKIDGVNPSYQ